MKYTNYLKKIKGFSNSTIKIYENIANKLELYELDYKKMLVELPEYSANSMRLFFSGIISYYKFLDDKRWKEISLPKKDFKYKEFVSYDEYKEMLSKINHKNKMGQMKRIVIRLLFETGIRSQELLSIKKTDIKKNEIKIHGKGRRERIVKISEWLRSELYEYIETKEEYIFDFQYKNLYKKVQTLSARKLTPHMFRRGYAKYCFEKGVSIYDISLSMGHSSIETTANYIKRNSYDVDIFMIF